VCACCVCVVRREVRFVLLCCTHRMHAHNLLHPPIPRCPDMKECALFALRNLCEGNAEVQAFLAALEARQVVPSAELDAAGLEAEIGADGRVRIKQAEL
jgi:hypothetical protein